MPPCLFLLLLRAYCGSSSSLPPPMGISINIIVIIIIISHREQCLLKHQFFQQQILLGNSISLHFTNVSASINTNLSEFRPVWVEFTSSQAHLNMNVGAAYKMTCHVFCLGACSHFCSSHRRLIFLAREKVPS